MICGCLTGSYWGVYKAWFPSCSDSGVIWPCFNSSTAPCVWPLFPNISSLCFTSIHFNLHFYRVKKKKNERPFSCQLSLDVFWSSTAHVRMMFFCTHLNIRMADYEGGMREHNPWGAESEKKGQKDERRLELMAMGLALHITQSKRTEVCQDTASVNNATKMVTIFSS